MNRDAYRTPPELFAALDAEFNFKLDVAASNENMLCDFRITEEENCLITDWFAAAGMIGNTGWFAWMNPPYSDIGPFVKRAAEMAKQGIGCVMLVMADTSVGWYSEAIKTCQEVRFIVGGRISFLDPVTGKPAAGNNKGSMFLIWHPFGRTAPMVSHVQRDELMAKGRELLAQKPAVEPAPVVEPVVPASPEINHKWPTEVIQAVRAAFDSNSVEPVSPQFNHLCYTANQMLLAGSNQEHINQVIRQGIQPCAA